jgi:outer membrane lipoprotein-sorting protein
MKIFLWTLLLSLSIADGFATKNKFLAVKDPAAASDLRSFYRSIQALSADSMLNGTAIAVV